MNTIIKNGNKVKVVIFATGISSRRSSNYKNSENYEDRERYGFFFLNFLTTYHCHTSLHFLNLL